MDLQTTSLDHCLYLRDIILTSFGPRIPTLRGISNLSIMYAPWMRFNDGGCISGIELSLIPFTNSLLQSSSPMPSGFTQSIEVVEIAEHRLQLDMAWQIQSKLKFSHLRLDWHSLLWSIANLGNKIRVKTTITASRRLCSSRLALCFSLCPLGHFSSSIHSTGSN